MDVGIFSEFQNGYSSNLMMNNGQVSKQSVQEDKSEKKNGTKQLIKTIVPIALPLIAIPITAGITYKLSAKNINGIKSEIVDLKKEIAKIQVINEEKNQIINDKLNKQAENLKKAKKEIWKVLATAAGVAGTYSAGKLSKEDKKDIKEKFNERMNNIENSSQTARYEAEKSMMLNSNSLNNKYLGNINGIQLLQNGDSLNKNVQKYNEAIETIKTSATKYLYEKPNITPITKEHPTLWSITSEFAPIKEGGLGSVPVEIQNNVSKLGIDIPTFIPMYQQKGIASFRQEGNKYIYNYKGKEFNLEKAASFKMDTYQNGRSNTENVEIFVSGDDKKLVFIKNDRYFNGTIYQSSEKTEEPEKFAFFSKAVYEFAKAKEDIRSVKDLVITNKEVFDSIKSPDGMILNDWQASPIAALARYKAPMENAFGQLNDDAAKKLSDMTIITIGHNAMYQGSTRNDNNDGQRKTSTSNILNTLFDNFAYDITINAQTNASKTDSSDEGLKNLDNVLILNAQDSSSNHTNLLNMGICLSNYFHPVSQNYTNEIVSGLHPELAGELAWAITQKNNAGSVVGIINGNDFNNLSIEKRQNMIKNQTGLEYKTYSKKSDINDVMNARTENKINFYNNFILPFSLKNDSNNNSQEVENIRKITSKLEFVDENGRTKLPKLTDEELKRTPVISSVGRLVSQKGIGIMADAIKILMDNWDKDFPGREKPIFYLAGQDGEGGVQRKYIEDLKNNRLSEEDSNRVVFAHGFAPMTAITASSDFFLLPSIFEPCGLTQGESFAVATPVIGSAVGGIVDTVNRNGKENGILTDPKQPLTPDGLYNAIKQGLKIYFEQPEKYKSMVEDSLAEDFSWIQKGKQGPIFDYLDKFGINRENLPEIA